MRQRIVDGTGTSPLDLLAQQLWLPSMPDDSVRVMLNPTDHAGWRTRERYWAIPSAARVRLLVPAGPAAASRGSLVNYRRLRRWRPRSVRFAAGQAARAAIPLAPDQVAVQSRVRSASPALPLAALADALGHDVLYTSIGVRTGANRKATLQLVDADGSPRGYAKLAWDEATADGIRTEARSLDTVGGRDGSARAPALLASGEIAGYPYLVSAPLPESVASPRRSDPIPEPQEIAALCPIHRRAPARETAHFDALSVRITTVLTMASVGPALGAAMRDIADRVAKVDAVLAIGERWHGDLAHWNTARDAEGRLWCWDWEGSESDAVAGLDALHWAFSRERQRGDGIGRASLGRAAEAAATHLWAVGTARHDWPVVAALYALIVAERAATLAARAGWPQVWIDEGRLLTVLASAAEMLDSRA